jgi:uncharacterized membrane protein YgcG
MVQVTAQAIDAFVRVKGQVFKSLRTRNDREWTANRIIFLILIVACLCPANPLTRISYAQDRDMVLPGSGIIYPRGYDPNTVGEVQGRISWVAIPESGPVRITLIADKETYTVLASPGWFWRDMDIANPEGMETNVRGSKTVGIDGNLYIIAQEIKMIGSKKRLIFRSESGKALWSGRPQTGRTNIKGGGSERSPSDGSGPSSGGPGRGSSGMGRGRR